MNKNSASAYCKARGFTLAQLSRHVGKKRETLNNWFNENRPLFECVVAGYLEMMGEDNE